ncbi:38013_t:CDS:2, partial [Gigaspora margarita]
MLLQQLQTALTSSQAKFYQRSLKEPCYTPIVYPQHLQQQFRPAKISPKGEPIPSLGNEKQEKEKPKNERINSYQNDEDPLNDVQNLFNCGCEYQNVIKIDNDKYEASEYNQALTPTSFDLSIFEGQLISIGYQKATKISSTCDLVCLQQKGIKGITRKYKYQNFVDMSYVCGVNDEPRTLVVNNKASVKEHNKDDNNILAFDQGK